MEVSFRLDGVIPWLPHFQSGGSTAPTRAAMLDMFILPATCSTRVVLLVELLVLCGGAIYLFHQMLIYPIFRNALGMLSSSSLWLLLVLSLSLSLLSPLSLSL